MSWSDCENVDDETSRQSVQSIGSDSNSRYDEDSTSFHVDTDYQDIDSFIQAVETHSDLIGSCDPVIVEDGWRLVLEDGLRDNCDWAIDENNRLSRPSHNFTSESRVCKSIWNSILSRSKESLSTSSQAVGYKLTTYNEIKAYLLSGMVPDHVSRTDKFKKKCAAYSLDERGYLMYSKAGFIKYVLLEGEVEQVLQQMHPQLGHCDYYTTCIFLCANFYVGCDVSSICKRYVSTCACDRSPLLRSSLKNVQVIFQRDSIFVSCHVFLPLSLIPKRIEACIFLEVSSGGAPGMVASHYDELVLYLRNGVIHSRLKDSGVFKKASVKYVVTHHGLVEKSTGRIVLSQRDSQAVLDDLHVIYGHQVKRLLAVVERRFICTGIITASYSYRQTCRFCRMRPGGSKYSASQFVENVDYDVSVSWQGDLRRFTITPKGLNRAAVDEYLRDVIEKCGGLPEDDTSSKANVPDKNLTDQQRAQYERVRRIDEALRVMKRSTGTPSLMKVDFDCTDSENSNLPPLQAPPSVLRDSSRSFAQNSVKSEVKPILKKDQKRKKASKRRVRWSLDDAEPSNDENAPPRTDPVTGKRKPGLSISATSDIECPSSPRSASDFVQDEETSDRADHALFIDPIPSNDDEWSMDELSDMFSDEENNVIVKEDLNLASITEDIDAPRAWQWSDMRPDEVYAYEEQMALQDFQQKQLDQNTLQHEVARLKVDEMRLQLADRMETESDSTGTFIDLGMHSSKAITDDVPKAEPSSIVCDDDNYRELAVADPYLFEQPVGHSSTAEHLVSLDSQNPFDIATCRYPPGYNVWNGVAWPLNPGPIRNPYADIEPRTDLRAALKMAESDESDMEDCWSDDEGADGNGGH